MNTPHKNEGGPPGGRAFVNRRQGKGCGGVSWTFVMAKLVGCYSHPRWSRRLSEAKKKKVPQSEGVKPPKRLENQKRVVFPGARSATGVPGEWAGAPEQGAGQTRRGCRGDARQTHNGEGRGPPRPRPAEVPPPMGAAADAGARCAHGRHGTHTIIPRYVQRSVFGRAVQARTN